MSKDYQKKWADNNKDKIRAASKKYRKAHPEKILDAKLRCKYGISINDYNRILESQDGKCAICRKEKCSLNGKLSIDHSHETNIVRGLLCNKCNLGLGSFIDNIELLKNAIKYLEKSHVADHHK